MTTPPDPAAVLARQKNKRSYSGEDVVELILALSQQTARVEALVELVFAERDLPLNIEPNYEDPRYTEKHERARLAREAANMPLPSVAALAAEQKEKS